MRRHRTALVIAAALLAAVVVALLVGGRPATTEPLDPDNPGGQGARAVARVLEAQGVEVRVVRGADALDSEQLEGSTVLVTSTYLLGKSTTRRLLAGLGNADLVLAEPEPGVVTALGLDVQSWAVSPAGDRSARCSDPLLRGLDVRVDLATEYGTAGGCFAGAHGHLVASAGDHITLLGASALLTNDQVLRADNAAVALRLLGQHDRLVWYVPEVADLIGEDGVSLRTLVPDWTLPGVWIAGAAVVALLLWRVRRLGPLVTEPLPVTVKAIETARSRGRLYRKAGDRAHAARALRRASRAALGARLHLPTPSDDAAFLREVSQHLGRPLEQVGALLRDDAPAPTTDDDLIRLANELAALEREVSSR
ncbi:DUF4350 domain-containing protein [Nocardioides agariphilus]|uniref:DUF4350 domain-containing protein n=1 Tax=Nocardioides agariphilus TaxID=433664 RepID=A0A930YJ36_9ACTN|nr:DUF4350 domain-containing protein [Nocardioides agariphilus]